MHRTIEKRIFTGVAAALAAILAIAVVAAWQMSEMREARTLGTVALVGSFAASMLLAGAWQLLRRHLRDRRETAQALRRTENLNLRLIESSADCIALLDAHGRLKVVNSTMWRWIEDAGFQPVEDLSWAETWAGELRAAAKSALAVADGGMVGRFEGVCYGRSGEGRWYDVTVTPIPNPDENPHRYLVVSRDVTDTRSADEKFRVLFEYSANAHFIFDEDRILDCNHAAVEMMGYPTKQELGGLSIDELAPECQPDSLPSRDRRRELWQLARDIGHFRYEWQVRRANGELLGVEIALTPVSLNGREVILAIWRDLTERQKAESALRESEQRFQAFMDHSPTLCFIKDDQGRMVFMNRVMAQGYGVSVSEMIGKNDFDWLPLEAARVVMEYDHRVLETNRAAQQIEVVTTAEGITNEWLVVKFPMGSPTGRKFLGGIGVDVKAQRRAERALKQSEATFRDLFDEAPVAYHELDTEGRLTRVNETELALLGYSADEMVGRHVWDFVVDAIAKEAVGIKLRGSSVEGDAFQRTFRRKDGTLIPVLIRDRLIRDVSGVVCGIRSTMQDISELKRAEGELRAAEEKYRKIFENAIEGIFQATTDGRYIDANPALASMLGYPSPAELLLEITDIGRQVYVDRQRYAELCGLLERDGSVSDFEIEIYRKDGSSIWVSEHTRAVRGENGSVAYYEGAIEDITARREVEGAMAKARDAALESARLKTQFLANMSHEIRTPMNGIIGMTGLLLDTELTPRQRDFTETIGESSEALLKIINEILDFSKIEAGMVAFDEVDFDLNEVVEGVVDLFAGRVLSKDIELSLAVSDDVPDLIRGDPGRLRQVLTNLVGNAVKFTDAGEVRVTIRCAGDVHGGVRLKFEVMDTGVGIPPDQQERLFHAFVQVDGSTTRRHGGTGLGLAISKRLVEQMRGEIRCESQPGCGSKFFFTAEFRKQPGAPERHRRRFDGIRVLVAGDSAPTREALACFLESSGAGVVGTASADEAIQILEKAGRENETFDLAMIDAGLCRADGTELVRAIRSEPRLAVMKLIHIASLDSADDSSGAADADVNGQVTKPLKQRVVHRCLESVFAMAKSPNDRVDFPVAVSAGVPVPPLKVPLRVLVAEDSEVNQKVVQFQLRKLGCEVHAVMDGEAALEAVSRKTFDVILMDCQMPRLDGCETSRRIRELESRGLRRTWIVAMTAHSLVGDRERCLAAGMDDYLSKPVRFRDLAAALEKCPTPDVSNDEARELWAGAVSREMLSDFRELEEESGQKMLAAVIILFLDTAPPVLDDVRGAVGRKDAVRVARAAHTLKGSCSNFGAHRMREACERLESVALQGVLENAEQLLVDVEREFGYVRIALENELPLVPQ